MANLRVLPFVAVAALLFVPSAIAQATPLQPTATIASFTVTPDASSPFTIALGGSQTFNLTVVVNFNNVYCQAPADSTVAITTAGMALPGIDGTPPQSIPIKVAANVAPPATPTQTTTGTGMAQFLVKVAPNAPAKHQHNFILNATYSAGAPSGCTVSPNPGDTFAPSPVKSAIVQIMTGAGAGNSTSTTGGTPCTGATCTTTPAGTSKASPLADVPTVALLFLGVALVVSRRTA